MRETEPGSKTLLAQSSLSLDQVFTLLADRERRYALYCLYEQPDDVTTLEEITTYIIAHTVETNETVDIRNHILSSLQHNHVPRLEDAGVVEYDARTETVRYWCQPTLEELLEHAYHKEFLD